MRYVQCNDCRGDRIQEYHFSPASILESFCQGGIAAFSRSFEGKCITKHPERSAVDSRQSFFFI